MHSANIMQAVRVHTGGGIGCPGLGPVNAFTAENVKRHFLSTELDIRRTDKRFGVSSKEGLTL